MRIGIVGCGLIGTKRAAEARREHQIVVVADLDLERAQRLAAATGARPTTNWKEAVAADVDIIIVATAHDMLAAVALAAIEAGRHVLVEKPAARTRRELEPIIAAAKRNGRLVKVGFNHRFHPAFIKARELVDGGAIGPLMFIRARYGHGGRVGYEKEWRCSREVSGGGELIDQGSHLVDLSRWFLGDLRLDYAALPTCFWPIAVDDNCFLALKTSDDRLAWLHASWTEWKNMFSFEIFGRDGKLMIDGLGGSYGVERLTFHRMLPAMGPPETTVWDYPAPDQSWAAEFAEFISAITQNRQPIGNIHDAAAVLDIVNEAYRRPS